MPQKALFYVRQTVANGWSRNVLHNFIDSSLYERHGKALGNFNRTLPDVDSDLVQEITKDPYNFAFAGITKPYNERILKDALLNNITKFLTVRLKRAEGPKALSPGQRPGYTRSQQCAL